MTDEVVPLSCGWKHPLATNDHSLCHRRKDCVKNPRDILSARRRESHPLFRLLSAPAHPIVVSDIFDKITSHNAMDAQWLVVQLL